ncbi:hypothetical protein [Pseudooceanicola aestuarii]|uniref:hypothetical protein n=1 Tax=Pseudooceanicola aestuarii TaxID=2697319 RepID=UPI0013D08D79|nr:hypothetical protein [Pseudooceanicola aestuarii]
MKTSRIALAVLPIVFGVAGYGAGVLLTKDDGAAPPHRAEHSGPRDLLNGLAEDNAPAHAPASTPVEHEAQVTPAALTLPRKPAPTAREEADRAHISPGTYRAPPRPVALKDPDENLRAIVRDSKVIKVGRVTVPVQNANSITYVVSDVGVSVRDMEAAEYFYVAQNASRLRDAILTSMYRLAETPALRGASIDTDMLSRDVSAELQAGFGSSVEDVLFLTLFKADVPRS